MVRILVTRGAHQEKPIPVQLLAACRYGGAHSRVEISSLQYPCYRRYFFTTTSWFRRIYLTISSWVTNHSGRGHSCSAWPRCQKNRGTLNAISTRAYNLLFSHVLRTTNTQSPTCPRLLQKTAIYVRWCADSQYLWDSRKPDRL